MPRTKIHPSITFERIEEALTRANRNCDNPGFCLACGEDAECVEPDARKYQCEVCGAPAVYGAQECLIMSVI